MKKRSASKVALVTAMAALPLARVPALQAQRERAVSSDGLVKASFPCCKFADRMVKQGVTVVGIDNGNPIYQNARKEYFSLDPATGDMRFVAPEVFMKFREGGTTSRLRSPLRMEKWRADKFGGQVTLVGVDEAGHVVQQNTRGEKFYLEPTTGDMVFVK